MNFLCCWLKWILQSFALHNRKPKKKSWRSRTEQKFTPTYWSQQSNTRSNKLSFHFCVQTSIGSFSSTDRYHIFYMINGNQKVGFDLLYVQVEKGKIWTAWWESRIDNWMTNFDPTRQETACKFLHTVLRTVFIIWKEKMAFHFCWYNGPVILEWAMY